MSSIEPDCSGGEVDGGEEISCGFVVACGDGAELFEFAEKVLDQVARLVEMFVKVAGRGAVAAERDDRPSRGRGERSDDPLVGVVSFVGDQRGSGDLRQQGVRAGKVMYLSGGQVERDRVAEGVDQSMDLGAQSAFAAADRLPAIVFFGAPALC